MTSFSLPENYTENPEKIVRRSQPRIIPPPAILPVKKPSSKAPLVPEVMVEKTLRSSPSPPPPMWLPDPVSMLGM